MRRPRPLALLAFAACCAAAPAVPGPAAAQTRGDWRALVGCYRMGDWHFALDSVPHVGVHADEDEARLARSSNSYHDRLEKMWRMPAPDSVRLRVEHGLYGSTWHLAVRGDALEGVVTHTSDIVPPPGSERRRPEPVRAVREPCLADEAYSNPPPDSAALAALYGYAANRPTRAQLEADPVGSVVNLRAWLAAHPEALQRHDIKYNSRSLFQRAASIHVGATALDLTGTYRLSVAREGGPAYLFYGRTEAHPWRAERHDTLAWRYERPTGYQLRFSLSRDSSTLPAPGPGHQHRDAYGGHGPGNSEIFVRVPPVEAPDRARRFAGSVMLVNFARVFRDSLLTDWDHTWYQRHADNMTLPPVGEFVLWPDGRVTFTQREEVGPGQVIVLRGERISHLTWECAETGCR